MLNLLKLCSTRLLAVWCTLSIKQDIDRGEMFQTEGDETWAQHIKFAPNLFGSDCSYPFMFTDKHSYMYDPNRLGCKQ